MANAKEQNGLYGGLFINRAHAMKFALFENGDHPETIIQMSQPIELEYAPSRPERIAHSRMDVTRLAARNFAVRADSGRG